MKIDPFCWKPERQQNSAQVLAKTIPLRTDWYFHCRTRSNQKRENEKIHSDDKQSRFRLHDTIVSSINGFRVFALPCKSVGREATKTAFFQRYALLLGTERTDEEYVSASRTETKNSMRKNLITLHQLVEMGSSNKDIVKELNSPKRTLRVGTRRHHAIVYVNTEIGPPAPLPVYLLIDANVTERFCTWS